MCICASGPVVVVCVPGLAADLQTMCCVNVLQEDAKPEFSNVSYFMMIYSCGVAVGLFFYGVSEPLYHLSGNRYAAAGYHTDNEKAQQAINLTLYHWGLHGWCVYCLVAVLMGFCCYLKVLRLPMLWFLCETRVLRLHGRLFFSLKKQLLGCTNKGAWHHASGNNL